MISVLGHSIGFPETRYATKADLSTSNFPVFILSTRFIPMQHHAQLYFITKNITDKLENMEKSKEENNSTFTDMKLQR